MSSPSRRWAISRLVTLGIRDLAQASGIDPATIVSMPLDDKLFAVKGVSAIALTTLDGRRTMPYRFEGYGDPWHGASPARLVVGEDALTILAGVTITVPQETKTMPETILTRRPLERSAGRGRGPQRPGDRAAGPARDRRRD
jgi:hypothetical protein